MQEPIAPALLPSFENFMLVSLFMMLSECFWMALLIGSSRYSLVEAMLPPMTINSGLNRFIRPAIARPRVVPISSMTSIASTSSYLTASMMSSMWICSPLLNFSERVEVLPSLSFSMNILYAAEPEAPVSRHPVLPQWHIWSLFRRGK